MRAPRGNRRASTTSSARTASSLLQERIDERQQTFPSRRARRYWRGGRGDEQRVQRGSGLGGDGAEPAGGERPSERVVSQLARRRHNLQRGKNTNYPHDLAG